MIRNITTQIALLSLIFSFSLETQDLKAAQNQVDFPESDEGLPGEGPIRRYDWFKKLWNKRRSAWQDSKESDKNALVFLGDSITQGWGDDFKNMFGETHLANRGISGDTTRGMLLRLHEDVLSLNPSGIVLLMGTNDLEEGAEPETIAANFKLILSEIQKTNSDLPVVLSLTFPSSEKKKRPADQIKKLNELYSEIARQFKQVVVLDTWTLFANESGDAKLEEFPDLLHPNQLGYKKWAAALIPVLETLDLLEVTDEEFSVEAGYRSLFNSEDLTGWGFRVTKDSNSRRPGKIARPSVKNDIDFSGQKQSSDGRYLAKNGRLIVTTPQEGRRIQQIWTTEEFPKDFTLKLEFRATPNADSGIFIRKPQLQCRDYLLAGPYKNLENYQPLDWNEIVIVVSGNTAKCMCNGEILEEEFKIPGSGPIGLEGDRGQIEYRRIRIKTVD